VRKPTLRHRIEYALTRGGERLVGVLPAGAAERAGEVIGSLARRPLGIRRRVVEENVRLAFPTADGRWVERVVEESYRHLGREAVAMLRLGDLDAAAVRDRVQIPDENWRAVEEALTEGRGVILATGHYGNWEMAAAAVAARGVPIAAIVKRQSNPLVNARIEATRRALGIETIDMLDAPRRVPRLLLAGHAIGIVADQAARRGGVWVPFFGVPARSHRGPALFALRLGTPLFAAVARRQSDGGYLLTGERLDTRPTGSLDADVARVTSELAAHLEREIRREPGQYFWFHKRWKTPPLEEHPSSLPGTKGLGVEDPGSS
jgi:Kdo2-lipid IVA lauroyltransferase/acyltransferase